jgi:hypothetical protein
VTLHGLIATSVKRSEFWGLSPCTVVDIDILLAGAYCLHL